MATQPSQLSNPFSTGGGGVHFENSVQASFVLLMLVDGFVPCLPLTTVEKIKLQGKYAGFQTDDVIVFSTDPKSGQSYKILGQIKHSITISPTNAVFGEVVKAAWDDYRNPNLFSRNFDRLALITGPISTADVASTRTILEWARSSQDANDFFMKVNLGNFSSTEKREKLEAFQVQLRNANNGVQVKEGEVFDFLKHFHLLGYDLDIRSGVEIALLHSLIGQYRTSDAGAVWLQLLEEVSFASQNAGTITKLSVRDPLRSVFQQRKLEVMPAEIASQLEAKPIERWSLHQDANSLMFACLLGAWNEKNEFDRSVIEELSREEFRRWIVVLQGVVALQNSPLLLSDGRWHVGDRRVFWKEMAPRIFDTHLDDFKNVAISVLGELDPRFELEKEERYAASIYGKNLKYSNELRSGVAETLTLLGVFGSEVDHASQSKVEWIVGVVIREILKPDDWKQWGSLDRLLPMIAEASPATFLDAVEQALRFYPPPFSQLFREEGSGVTGGNYLTGLLWALETLAWSEELITRVVLILGELASLDPGGNWANRPGNSIVTIFLPWFPQTLASVQKRKIALRTLAQEFPSIASRLLIRMLPNQDQTSSGSHKSKYRNPLPPDFKVSVTNAEYWEQVEIVAGLLVEMAASDATVLVQLVAHLDNLPKKSFEALTAFLASDDFKEQNEDVRSSTWEALVTFVVRHRKFATAHWALDKESVDNLEILAKGLIPTDLRMVFRRLFKGNDIDLYEESGDWEVQQQRLETARQDAARAIVKHYGINGILEFSASIENSARLGWSMGQIEDIASNSLFPLGTIGHLESGLSNFMAAYVASKYERFGLEWIQSLDLRSWKPEQIIDLLCRLPFTHDIWSILPDLLGANEKLYWTRISPNPFAVRGDVAFLVPKLLDAGRPRLALECLFADYFISKNFKLDLVKDCFLATLTSDEPLTASDPYHITELIKELQNRLPADSGDLFQIEWAYLPYLDRMNGAEPKSLERKLATDSDFFCELIRNLYRSDKVDVTNQEEPELNEQRKAIAHNAWTLLNDWKRIPGMLDDGDISIDLFSSWVKTMKASTSESGHSKIAGQQLGKVLFYSPPDKTGLWIHRTIADELNKRDSNEIRTGYSLQVFNSRGVHAVDPSGAEERKLASSWREKAQLVEDAGFVRFATTLRDLASDFDREAERVVKQFDSLG